MPGSKEGARKAHLTRLKKDPNYYAKIAKQSWKNPNRSRKTGFALLDPQQRSELGRKGGKKTKNEYRTMEGTAQSPNQPPVRPLQAEVPETDVAIQAQTQN